MMIRAPRVLIVALAAVAIGLPAAAQTEVTDPCKRMQRQ